MPGTELFGTEEKKEIVDVLETGVLFRYNHEHLRNNIWKAKDFEAEVCKFTNSRFAHAVSSGSAAVAAALAAAGIGTGDEVIVPPFTFIATIEAVLFVGALPVFADIDETLCLSADGIKKAISTKTKAVCLVHMCGGMAQMDEIMDVCNKHNLILVEDAGQALGASFNGTKVGLFGAAGSYSFDFFKIATCGEGGVVVTNDENIYKLVDTYTDHGHDHVGNNRGMENHPILGFNYRISELHAAIGLAQMRKVPTVMSSNRKNKAYLINKLQGINGLGFAKLADPEGDSATFLNILFDEPDQAALFVKNLNEGGIGGFNYWFTNMYHFVNQWNHLKDFHTASKLPIEILGSPQDYKSLHIPNAQNVVGRLVSFGIRCTWSKEEMDNLADNIRKCATNAILELA